METTKPQRKIGAPKKDPDTRKQSHTISLSPTQGEQLDTIAKEAGITRSELIIRKFKLK